MQNVLFRGRALQPRRNRIGSVTFVPSETTVPLTSSDSSSGGLVRRDIRTLTSTAPPSPIRKPRHSPPAGRSCCQRNERETITVSKIEIRKRRRSKAGRRACPGIALSPDIPGQPLPVGLAILRAQRQASHRRLDSRYGAGRVCPREHNLVRGRSNAGIAARAAASQARDRDCRRLRSGRLNAADAKLRALVDRLHPAGYCREAPFRCVHVSVCFPVHSLVSRCPTRLIPCPGRIYGVTRWCLQAWTLRRPHQCSRATFVAGVGGGHAVRHRSAEAEGPLAPPRARRRGWSRLRASIDPRLDQNPNRTTPEIGTDHRFPASFRFSRPVPARPSLPDRSVW